MILRFMACLGILSVAFDLEIRIMLGSSIHIIHTVEWISNSLLPVSKTNIIVLTF